MASPEKRGRSLGEKMYGSKGELVLRAMNLTWYRKQYGYGVCRIVGDIALVPCYRGNEDFYPVQRIDGAAFGWRYSKEQLLSDALENTFKAAPARIHWEVSAPERKVIPFSEGRGRIRGAVAEERAAYVAVQGTSAMAGTAPMDCEEGVGSLHLTTEGGRLGAVAFFYPGMRERLARMIGGDYYAVFPSAHECIIHPITDGALPEALHGIRDALCHVNAVFPGEDMLSARVYHYKSYDGILEVL